MPTHYDAVVIGSGFGGGTVALRLAQAGKSVCVLERGRRWRGANMPSHLSHKDARPFPRLGDTDFFWGRQLWRPNRQRLGLFDLKQMFNLQGLVGAGVGGGSLIWANVVIEAPEWVFEQRWPKAITRRQLQPYYERAAQYLRPSVLPGLRLAPGALQQRQVERAAALKLAAARIGAPWNPVRVAVNFADQQQPAPNGFGTANQLGCNYCGLCSAGCPQNAKNTVDVSYIAAAEGLGAEVRPLHTVTTIEPVPGGNGYRVHFARYDADGNHCETDHVNGRAVVICAGTFGTTEMLLRARKQGTLPNLSTALGAGFSINGNVLSGALNPDSRRPDPAYMDGPSITSMVDFGRHVVEDYAYPWWGGGLTSLSNWERATAFVSALAGRKPSTAQLASQARDMLTYVGVGADQAHGRLHLGAFGRLAMHWPGGVENDPIVRDLHRSMAAIARALGRQYVPNVSSLFNRAFTYHPLGGCAMADNADSGVVDADGAVYGYDGLFIADGSVVPTALGRNPSFTIAALSERIAEAVKAKLP